MSQIPPPLEPIFPEYGTPVAPSERPTSVTVIAIIAIVLGSLGLLCFGMFMVLSNIKLPGGGDPFQAVPVLHTLSLIALGVSLIMTILELAGGIGLLALKRWARQLMIVWAIASLVVTVAQVMVQLILYLPAIPTLAPPAGMQAAAYHTTLNIQIWVGAGVALVMLIWPILVLYYMAKPHVKQAFGIGAAQP